MERHNETMNMRRQIVNNPRRRRNDDDEPRLSTTVFLVACSGLLK
jgi:hypothetical protein